MNTKPEDSLTSKWNESISGQVLVILVVIAVSMFRIAGWLSRRIILFQMYGSERVSREHLQIVTSHPQLVVSNGDVLGIRAFEYYLIGGAIGIALSILLFSQAWKLLPKPIPYTMLHGPNANRSNLLAMLLFLAIGLLPIRLALILAAVVLLSALLAARTSSQRGLQA